MRELLFGRLTWRYRREAFCQGNTVVLVVGVLTVADNGRRIRDMMSLNESLICLRALLLPVFVVVLTNISTEVSYLRPGFACVLAFAAWRCALSRAVNQRQSTETGEDYLASSEFEMCMGLKTKRGSSHEGPLLKEKSRHRVFSILISWTALSPLF